MCAAAAAAAGDNTPSGGGGGGGERVGWLAGWLLEIEPGEGGEEDRMDG
jgi:hypothetical protein